MQLFYREKGNTAHPPLIILHGLWGASDNWLSVAERLAAHFHVILPDCRNHGHSPHAPAHDYEILSQELEEFITGLNLPQSPFIVGHSMGGKALMRLLLKKPEMATKAAILDIAPVSYPLKTDSLHHLLLETILRFPLHQYQSRQEIQEAIRQQLPTEEACQILFKNLRKTTTGFEWKINVFAIEQNMQALLDWPLVNTTSSTLPPTLFIRGEYSDYINEQNLPAIFSLFPETMVTTLPKASHFLHQEQPALLVQTLIRFFGVDVSES